jgi:hypothetical protein
MEGPLGAGQKHLSQWPAAKRMENGTDLILMLQFEYLIVEL